MQSYYKRLTSDNRELLEAARARSIWESALAYEGQSELHNRLKTPSSPPPSRASVPLLRERYFLERPNQLIEDVPKIRHIPAVIVQDA
jgi:proline iminopeptidase